MDSANNNLDIVEIKSNNTNFEKETHFHLSPTGDCDIKQNSSYNLDLNIENNQCLEAGENTLHTSKIKDSVDSLSKWEEGNEREVKIIEPMKSYSSKTLTYDDISNIGEYSYWSSVGLLKKKQVNPLYLGPDEKKDTDSIISVYDEQVLNLISPSDESVCEESDTDIMHQDHTSLMEEISLDKENDKKISVQNDELVEKLKLNEKKKGCFVTLFREIFSCISLNKAKK